MIRLKGDQATTLESQLIRFELQTSDPRWSSFTLGRFVDEFLAEDPRGSQALYEGLRWFLKKHSVRLTQAVAAFLKDIVVLCRTRTQGPIGRLDWDDLVEEATEGDTEAQLYLALQVVPPGSLTPRLAATITKGLEPTLFRNEVLDELAP